ncbi:TonB-dependent receptor plug domain-containing protein [Marinicellulosiphila megalodicopiae]|uniref:TonB-dependent receptor plug domain-containing protein n=1 Tax=Marinicellulosiphila megalodicopiae TaxID=2724896 RepID=UPI003BAEA8B6
MKYLLSFLIICLPTFNAAAVISDDWLDDDALFDADIENAQPATEIKNDGVNKKQKADQTGIKLNTVDQGKKIQIDQSPDGNSQSKNSDNTATEPAATNQAINQATTEQTSESNQSTNSQLEDVVITGQVDKTTMSEQTQKLFSMPGAGGDPLKALEALPGITSEFSFVGAPSVRGSAPEDNSYLIDNLPVANLYHLLGYSIFSDNIVQNFDIQMGAFPAKYAGGTGAAIYVDLREPKNEPFSWVIDLGMFHSGVFLESKITENQSVYFGARKSTISYFAPLFIADDEPEELEEGEAPPPIISQFPNSDDLYFKYHNTINKQNSIDFSILGAQDYFGIEFPEGSEIEDTEPALSGGPLAINNKQSTSGLNWEFQKDNNNRFVTTLGYLFFNSEIVLGDGYFNNLDVNSLIVKSFYENSNNAKHIISVGAELVSDHAVYTSRLLNTPASRFNEDGTYSSGVLVETDGDITINYLDGFVQDKWFINDHLTFTNGAHVSYDDYIEDSIFQPRSEIEFNWYDEWILKSAFGVHHQYPEILSLLPDFGNPDLKNITANHYVFSVEKNNYSGLKIKVDTFYKQLNNLVIDTSDERRYSNQGSGDAYGLEILVEQEKIGDFSGFVALSLSKSTRTNEITDVTNSFELDKPFVFDFVLDYEPNEKWKIGGKWNLKSGSLYTPILGGEPNPTPEYSDTFIPIYGESNSKRFPVVHQLDMRIEYNKVTPKKEITYYVDIINVYNQKIVQGYSYSSDYSEIEDESTGFPFLPLFGMKMSF